VTGSSPQPEHTGRTGGEIPHVNSGSPTFPLDVAAALTSDGKTLTVSVVNPTESAHELTLEVRGLQLAGGGKTWRMAPGSILAANLVGREPQVRVEEMSADVSHAMSIPALSVAVYSLPVR